MVHMFEMKMILAVFLNITYFFFIYQLKSKSIILLFFIKKKKLIE